MDMLAMLLTLAFTAVAALAIAVISASFAKGFAAVTVLRRQIALCNSERTVTVRHGRTARARPVAMRVSRRPIRPVVVAPVRLPERAAA